MVVNLKTKIHQITNQHMKKTVKKSYHTGSVKKQLQ